jgi:hypothetical protein
MTLVEMFQKGIIELDDEDDTFDTQGYVSYLICPEYVLLVESTWDRGEYYRANYIQHLAANVDGGECCVIQLEGLPEEPAHYNSETDIPSKIFKAI